MTPGTPIVTDYFAAPTDEVAATVVYLGVPPTAPARGSGKPLFDTVCLPHLDPFVTLGRLAHLLSGRTYREVTADPRHGALVVDGGAEGPWVVTVADGLVAELAASSPRRLEEAARDWGTSATAPSAHAVQTVGALRELAELAARAIDVRHHLYCWTSLTKLTGSA